MLWLVCVAPCIVLLYGKTLWFEFVGMDDGDITPYMPYFTNLWNIFRAFGHDSATGIHKTFGLYRPLSEVYQIVIISLSKVLCGSYSPAVLHAGTVLLHGAVSGLLWRLLRYLGHSPWNATFLTILFVVHPLATTAVGWVFGHNEMLLALFSLVVLQQMLRPERNNAAWGWLFLSAFAMLCTKESAVPLLAVCVACGIVYHRERLHTWQITSSAGAALVLYLALRTWALRDQDMPIDTAILAPSFATAWRGVLVFLDKIVMPWEQCTLPRLADMRIHLLPALALLGIFAYASSREEGPGRFRGVLGFAWFVAGLILTFYNTFGADYVMREDRVYAAGLGLVLAVSPSTKPWSLSKSIFGAALVCALCIFNSQHIAVYRNMMAYYGDAVRGSPRLSMAHLHLGDAYLNVEDYDNAQAEYRQTLALHPEERRGHNNLGVLFLRRDDAASARMEFMRELALYPEDTLAWYNLGLAQRKLGDVQGAEASLRHVISLDADYGPAYADLASLYNETGNKEALQALIPQMQRVGVLR